jgi:hypothetical protein
VFPKVHPAEFSMEFLGTLGFRPVGGHRLYAATARPSRVAQLFVLFVGNLDVCRLVR